MNTFIVDGRVQVLARVHLPKDMGIEVLDLTGNQGCFDFPVNKAIIAGIASAGHAQDMRDLLQASPYATLPVVELDPAQPDAGGAELIRLLIAEIATARRQLGEARAVAARLRTESVGINARLREIESLLDSLGNPQLSNALSWQPTGAMLPLESGQSVQQALPLNMVSLSAIDLWFPQVIMPMIDHLAVQVEDAAGQAYSLQAASPDMGLETGWLRFCLPEPVAGVGRDYRLRLAWSGADSISLGLGLAVPDPRFAAVLNTGETQEQTLAIRVWQSLGGVRLPPCTPTLSSGRAVSTRQAEFVAPSALPAPELFALPLLATDHVSTAFWEKEDSILVHPSRSGPACAIIRGVDLAGLSHVSALVTVGHVRAPSLNFAVGVAPHGLVDEDGFWQRRIGPWITGLPARGWGQAHCIPVEPIIGKADILLAVSLATDVPNDLSWGLFRGFRFSRGDDAPSQAAFQPDARPVGAARA